MMNPTKARSADELEELDAEYKRGDQVLSLTYIH